jgi:uroporphyrinogen III methyltransferase/synthase
VQAFFDIFFKLYHDARDIGGAKLVAIGQGTEKKLREFHLGADFVPQKAVAESLVKELIEHAGSMENQTVLWVRPDGARDVVAAALHKQGAIVDEAIAYRTVPETSDLTGGHARFREEGADLLTFASSSAVDSFFSLGLPLPKNVKIVSIGPVTTGALKRHRLRPHIEAKQHDIPGIVAAIKEHYAADSQIQERTNALGT